MKSRSHRLQPSDPPDDWGDGSWTVDCSCGVTFDDGEEMVSCDICGVWVHTRCSRFVRSAASFACHNCKAQNPNPNPNSYSSLAEETEVAQLLIELPTKAPDPPPIEVRPGPQLRLWAGVPRESSVHVQGIPGGDPALFEGISSSVFTADLWRCSGYVPKKFNFQYRELSCRDEDGGENGANLGADVLFSMSNSAAPRVAERLREERRVQLQGWGKKERNRVRVAGSHSSKRRREDYLGKKRVRGGSDRAAADIKKSSLTVADTSRAGLDIAGVKNEEIEEERMLDKDLAAEGKGMECGSRPKHVLVIKSDKRAMLETMVMGEEDDRNKVVDSNVSDGAVVAKVSVQEEDISKSVHGLRHPKDESHYEGDLNVGSCHVVLDEEKPRATIAYSILPDVHDLPVPNGAVPLSIKLQKAEVKTDVADGQDVEIAESMASPGDDGSLRSANHAPRCGPKSSGHSSEILQEQEIAANLPCDEHKPKEVEKEEVFAEQVYDKISDEMETGVSEPKQHGEVVEESLGSTTVLGGLSEPGHVSVAVEEPKKCEDLNFDDGTPSLRKPLIDVSKAPSNSFTPVTSKPSLSSSSKLVVSTSSSSTTGRHLTKQQRAKVTPSTPDKKDNAASVSSAECNMREVSRHPVKGHSKSADYHGSKSSESSRIPYFSASKHAILDSRELPFESSSKSSPAVNPAVGPLPVEAIGLSDSQNSSKQVSSGSLQKSERLGQPNPQLPSKLLNHISSRHPPACGNAATALSDEELAFLLHQELNSSHRVPRVPRMHQAPGMQVASPLSPSMLPKRSSYSGGKDQVFRRKNKEEASRDSSRNSNEFVNEPRRVSRASSLPDHRYRESVCMAEDSAKKDIRSRSPDTVVSLSKNVPGGGVSNEGESETSCLPSFEAAGETELSMRNSPRGADDAIGVAHRTLPVLLEEIISKGKCSTYQELCIAVRPHWNSLRKPNGFRYAYSSHSHAVLDCLRNRSEWAHLIDRGPKTNSNKRRRKADTELPEEEESEYEEEKRKGSLKEFADKSEKSHPEDFPKRKRNVRKRSRRSKPQGQNMEDTQMRKHSGRESSEDGDDDDDDVDPAAAMSNSSNGGVEGLSSEEESHGGEVLTAGAEVSTSAVSGGA